MVNDHMSWYRGMTNIGSSWNHSDRKGRNMTDKGEQTCMMSLLFMDHKSLTFGSKEPVPNRPVISGNSGLNCHLSKFFSQVVDLIAHKHDGEEVDSTDDMISKIGGLNSCIRSRNLGRKHEVVSQVEKIFENNETLANKDHSDRQKFNKDDIRNFGKIGVKTSDSTRTLNKARLYESLKALKNARKKGSVAPCMSDRMNAGVVLDKIFQNEQIPLPPDPSESKLDKTEIPPIQKDVGLSVQ